MKDRIIVAVDGPAGSGKSTVSKAVALRNGLKYIDSGAIYRSVTWFFLNKYGSVSPDFDFRKDFHLIGIRQEFGPDGSSRTFVNGQEVTSSIRDESITKSIGIVSDSVDVRNFVNSMLRDWSKNDSIIMDGRDIGTVVFPDADLKVYLDATPEIRASRRIKEYAEMGKNLDEKAVANQIIQRDRQDMSRAYGALKKSPDAVFIDTSDMPAESVVERISEHIAEKLGKKINRGSRLMADMPLDHNESIDMAHVADSALDGIEPGSIVKGEIVTIDSDYAYINVGMKSDGRISLAEFDEKPALGDTVNVMLIGRKFVDGVYQFSRRAAEEELKWDEFLKSKSHESGIIFGRIKSPVKNGKIVDCGGIIGFLPFSLAADLKGANSNDEYEFKIKSIDSKKKQLLLSRKDFVDEEYAVRWKNFTSKYKPNDRITGTVVRFVEFGAFVRIEGLDALLHRNDISWKKVFKQRKILKLNEEREFVILTIDDANRKISLGLKQLTEDPWISLTSRLTAGSRVQGEVVTLTNSGAFIEIEDGIEGFLSNSELSWTKTSVNVNDVLKKGDTVEVQVLDINPADKKISLGIKQLLPNPWDNIDKRFPVGSIHKSRIKKILKFGIFVEIEGDIDGLIHASDISWDPLGREIGAIYKENDEIEFKILSVKKDEMRISCGIKQLIKSPWDLVVEKYPPRTKVEGVISKITPFGIFVKIEDNVEGYVHISEVSKKRIEKLEDEFKTGEKIGAVVIGSETAKRRLSLSIKNYEIISEKEELDKILKNASPSRATLGDFVKIKLGE